MLLLVLACTGPDPGDTQPVDPSVQWQELSEEDLNADSDDKDDTGKDTGWPECGPEVVLGQPCQGDWTTTTCLDDQGEYWWCEGGVWTTGK